MHPEQGPVTHAAGRMAEAFGDAPRVAVVLGSGLGTLVEQMQRVRRSPYAELGLPASTVAGHASEIVYGELGGNVVAVLSGRVHCYEGRSLGEVVRYVRRCMPGACSTSF